MIQNNSRFSKLPKNPAHERTEEQTGSSKNNDYYINNTVETVFSKFKKGKGMPVDLDSVQLIKLTELKAIFGDQFGLNEVICFAFHKLQGGDCGAFDEKVKNEDVDIERTYFKPSRDAVRAIMMLKDNDAAKRLIKIGLFELHLKLVNHG
ncbi:hypothetical protein ACO0LB_19195 [Undibacterium sp. SXout7W]|uniref:hypothetical protein n=1 Tax=Undibacterium sp. SXout7W TaxID=3413049 RepID=UPI003BF14CCB